ncbi:hypothetical protein EDD15DRAFT_2201088 [Pisolithus albus]|nr:hypothetical protein EDD15DRAFT_2201088 [Pisolithus albus]
MATPRQARRAYNPDMSDNIRSDGTCMSISFSSATTFFAPALPITRPFLKKRSGEKVKSKKKCERKEQVTARRQPDRKRKLSMRNERRKHPANASYPVYSRPRFNRLTDIEDLNDSIIGVKLVHRVSVSPVVEVILGVLDKVENLASHGQQGFTLALFPLATLPHSPEDATAEVSACFANAWSNCESVDYGSRMEINFLCWLLIPSSCIGLERVGILSESDHIVRVIRTFWRYIQAMHILQSTYWLEPAGSCGVWGLDDHHSLPILFGSTRLGGHKYLCAKAIRDNEVIDELANDLSETTLALTGFSDTKLLSGGTRQCWTTFQVYVVSQDTIYSTLNHDASLLKIGYTGDKVIAGTIRTYEAEVLPVLRHFPFGSVLPYDGPPPPPETGNECTHGGHVREGWSDCCGIPTPSAFAAAQERTSLVEGNTIFHEPPEVVHRVPRSVILLKILGYLVAAQSFDEGADVQVIATNPIKKVGPEGFVMLNHSHLHICKRAVSIFTERVRSIQKQFLRVSCGCRNGLMVQIQDRSESRISASTGRKRGKTLSSADPKKASPAMALPPMQISALPASTAQRVASLKKFKEQLCVYAGFCDYKNSVVVSCHVANSELDAETVRRIAANPESVAHDCRLTVGWYDRSWGTQELLGGTMGSCMDIIVGSATGNYSRRKSYSPYPYLLHSGVANLDPDTGMDDFLDRVKAALDSVMKQLEDFVLSPHINIQERLNKQFCVLVVVFLVLRVVADTIGPPPCESSNPTWTTAAVLQFVSDQTKLANLIATPGASPDILFHELKKEDRANLEVLQWVSLLTEQSHLPHGRELSRVTISGLLQTSLFNFTSRGFVGRTTVSVPFPYPRHPYTSREDHDIRVLAVYHQISSIVLLKYSVAQLRIIRPLDTLRTIRRLPV